MRAMEHILLHPIRIRIIQLFAYHPSMTVADLVTEMSDIPRSTIYRQVSILHQNNILSIVKEQRVRGTYEREYTLNTNAVQPGVEQAEAVAGGILLKLFSDFSAYFQSDCAKPDADKLFLTVNSLMLSDQEFDELTAEIYNSIKKYLNRKPNGERKPRTLSLISSPCIEPGTLAESGKEDNN